MKKQPSTLWIMGMIYPLITYAFGTLNSLLVLYLREELHFSATSAYGLFAMFNALVFIIPIFGGYLADYFGHREATVVGMALCLFGLLVPGEHSLFMLKFGLATFAVGLAVCATTSYCLLDFSYDKQDKRREAGFTLFYLMFNVGFLISVAAAGFVAKDYGYHVAFTTAAIAVFIAIILFTFSLSKIKPFKGRTLHGKFDLSPISNLISLFIALGCISFICYLLLGYIRLGNILIFAIIILSVIALIIFAMRQKQKVNRMKLFAFLGLCILSIGFWALYMLEPSLLTIFIHKNVDRHIFGFLVPASSFYSLDALYIIILGLIFSYIWRRLAAKNKDFSIPTKFTASLFAMGIGYLIFVIGIYFVGSTHMVNVSWIFIGYIFLSTAELLISPTGLSMVGRLSPSGYEGVLMGVWQLYTGFSAVLSGYLADIAVTPKGGTPATTNPIYAHALMYISGLAIVFGIIAIFFVPKLKRLTMPQQTTN